MTRRNNELLQKKIDQIQFFIQIRKEMDLAINKAFDKYNQIELSYQRKAYFKSKQIEKCYQQFKRV